MSWTLLYNQAMDKQSSYVSLPSAQWHKETQARDFSSSTPPASSSPRKSGHIWEVSPVPTDGTMQPPAGVPQHQKKKTKADQTAPQGLRKLNSRKTDGMYMLNWVTASQYR